MAFYVYMLLCGDNSFYVGQTDDVEARVAAHQAGVMPGYTKSRLPVQVVFVQEFGSRAEALESERQIKRWSRGKKAALVRGDWATIQRLAQKQG